MTGTHETPAPPNVPLLLTPAEAATALGVTVGQLRDWRGAGRGPAYHRIGVRLIRYPATTLHQHTTPPLLAVRKAPLMTVRTITGNLAANPETVHAGSITITKIRVVENTGEYRAGTWHPHPTPTTHHVGARFELGENTAATLHKGDLVIGREHTETWDDNTGTHQYRRVIDADHIGVDLNRVVAHIRIVTTEDSGD